MGEVVAESGVEQEELEGPVQHECAGWLMGMRSLVCVAWWRGTTSPAPSPMQSQLEGRT